MQCLFHGFRHVNARFDFGPSLLIGLNMIMAGPPMGVDAFPALAFEDMITFGALKRLFGLSFRATKIFQSLVHD